MTQTDIANLALCKIGESLIDNIDDTGDNRARKAKLHYAPTLREVLRAHFWGFAMGVGLVAKQTGAIDTMIIGWTNGYTLPADFIKLRRVLTVDGDKIEHFDFRRIDAARCLVAGDHDELALEYVQFVDDPADYDPLFVNAFATLLASRLARAISGSEKAEADLRGLYESVDLPAARTADGHDSQSSENHPLQEFLSGNLLGPRSNFYPSEVAGGVSSSTPAPDLDGAFNGGF